MVRQSLCGVAIALALGLGAATTAQAAAFQNGSFETGTLVNPGSFDILSAGSTVITGWTVTAGTIDYIGAYWQAGDGSRSLDMVGTSSQGAIAQTFDTTPGALYQVSFQLSGNPDGAPAIKTLSVSAGGSTPTSTYSFDTTGQTKTAMGWSPRSYFFQAQGTSTTLTFAATSSPSTGAGPALDDVRVAVVPPAPINDTWFLALMALLLLASYPLLRSRQKGVRLD